jgi:UDPglucose--hexose-1-phosphate uridylyltransferase
VSFARRSAIRLSDGRELIYFDEHAGADRSWPDLRHLPPPPPTSQLRYDALIDEWVAVAAHRQTRTFLPPSDKCPLCPSTPDFSSEIPAPDYDVVVFENQFPSFSDRIKPDEITEVTDLVPVRAGIGRCEVVCFTSDHNASFGALPASRVRTVIDALADRTAEMSELPGVAQVFPFENRGIEIGVTLSHPHGQIYAYPTVPARTQTMLAALAHHCLVPRRDVRHRLAEQRVEPVQHVQVQRPECVALGVAQPRDVAHLPVRRQVHFERPARRRGYVCGPMLVGPDDPLLGLLFGC